MRPVRRPLWLSALALPILLSMQGCGEPSPAVVTKVETRLPPDPSGFPLDSAPPPVLPPIRTVQDWERATLALIVWGRENASRVDGWGRWWSCQKELVAGRRCSDAEPHATGPPAR